MSKKNKEERKEEHLDQEVVEQETMQNEKNNEDVEVKPEEASQEEILTAKLAELNDKYLRLYSDFDNYRKRTSKEKLDIITNANEGIIKDLLTVLDDFDRAIENNTNAEDVEGVKEGFQLIFNKFKNILVGKGLKPMDSKGEKFDLELHEAITNIPTGQEEDKGKVVDVVEKGYFLNDKVIRYAKVVVGQ